MADDGTSVATGVRVTSPPPLHSPDRSQSPRPASRRRDFRAAASAALAFPIDSNQERVPRRRHSLWDLSRDEDDGDDSVSNVDELDREQLSWASPPTASRISLPQEPSLQTPEIPSPAQDTATKHLSPQHLFDKFGRHDHDHGRRFRPAGDFFDLEAKSEARTPPVTGPLPPPFVVGRAIFDFAPRDAKQRGFLTFKKVSADLDTVTVHSFRIAFKGDLIVVTGSFQGKSSWWYGKRGGESGLFLAYRKLIL